MIDPAFLIDFKSDPAKPRPPECATTWHNSLRHLKSNTALIRQKYDQSGVRHSYVLFPHDAVAENITVKGMLVHYEVHS